MTLYKENLMSFTGYSCWQVSKYFIKYGAIVVMLLQELNAAISYMLHICSLGSLEEKINTLYFNFSIKGELIMLTV